MAWGINYHYEQTIITKKYPFLTALAAGSIAGMLIGILYNAAEACASHAGKAIGIKAK
jgi:hypothetical protein